LVRSIQKGAIQRFGTAARGELSATELTSQSEESVVLIIAL
jgi:hypothetical protein